MEKLFEHGALDVFFVPNLMKKNRPGIQINVLCTSKVRDLLIKVLLTETSTFGVRYYAADRVILNRDFIEINTQWGTVRAKRGYLNGVLIKTVPSTKIVSQLQNKTVYHSSLYFKTHSEISNTQLTRFVVRGPRASQC